MKSKVSYIVNGDSMYPRVKHGETLALTKVNSKLDNIIKIDDLVVFLHPFKKEMKLIKKVKKIIDKSYLFVEGENPDPNLSLDSHNFGLIRTSDVIAYKKG